MRNKPIPVRAVASSSPWNIREIASIKWHQNSSGTAFSFFFPSFFSSGEGKDGRQDPNSPSLFLGTGLGDVKDVIARFFPPFFFFPFLSAAQREFSSESLMPLM